VSATVPQVDDPPAAPLPPPACVFVDDPLDEHAASTTPVVATATSAVARLDHQPRPSIAATPFPVGKVSKLAASVGTASARCQDFEPK
jgi:hypothetical protein